MSDLRAGVTRVTQRNDRCPPPSRSRRRDAQTVSTSAGPSPLPILYTDASPPYARVTRSIRRWCSRPFDSRGFEPLVIFGKAWAVFCAFENIAKRRTRSYGELGVGVLVKRGGTSPSVFGLRARPEKGARRGDLRDELPVTTERDACGGGRAMGLSEVRERNRDDVFARAASELFWSTNSSSR